MIGIQQVWQVARRTCLNRMKSFSFWASLIGPLMIPIISIIFGYMISNSSTPKLAVVGQPEAAQFLREEKSSDLTITDVVDDLIAQKQLDNGEIDGFLTEVDGKYILSSTNESGSQFDQIMLTNDLTQYQIKRRAAEMDLSVERVATLLAPASLTVETKSADGQQLNDNQVTANGTLAIIVVVGIFIFLTLYVGVISQEIANEKSNRIMEILLAVTSSRVQYYGKILGVVLLATAHIVIYVVGGMFLYFAFKTNPVVEMAMTALSGLNMGFVAYISIMSVIAVIGFLVLAAIVASLVNDQSQAQQATQPIIFLGAIGYIASFALAVNPSNIILRVISFIPFISPTLMTARYANQSIGLQEAMIALLLQVIAVIFVAWFGERIYARNVLSYSEGNLMKQLLKNLRSNSNSIASTSKNKG